MTDSSLESKIAEWLEWDRNEDTSSEIRRLAEEKNYERLRELLMERLTFGTAGLRSTMGPGYAAMNDLVIIQTGQGMLGYLEDNVREPLKKSGVVIGYDGRHNSRR